MQSLIATPYLILAIIIVIILFILTACVVYNMISGRRSRKADKDVEALSDRSDLMSAAWSDPALRQTARPQMAYHPHGPTPPLAARPHTTYYGARQEGPETPMDEYPPQLTPGRNYGWEQAILAQRADLANARTRAQRQEWEAATAQARGDLHPSRMPGMARQ